MITTDAVPVGEEATAKASQSQYWGLGRVIGPEQPKYRCRLIDVASGELSFDGLSDTITEILLTETQDNQLVVRDGQIHVPRMKQARAQTERTVNL